MKELSRFELPLHSMSDGSHHYTFQIDSAFFLELEQDLIKSGEFEVQMDVDKRSDLVVLDIAHQGVVRTSCDRCAEPIDLPIKEHTEIIIKFVDDFRMDDEVTYLLKGTEKLDLAPFIFEAISLSLPLVHRYDCEDDQSAPCSKQVLDILKGKAESGSTHSSIWDDLKKLNLES